MAIPYEYLQYSKIRGAFLMEKKIKISNDRKVVSQKGSLYVNIPKAFVERHDIKPGDTLTVIDRIGNLKIVVQKD